jgi:hypothetical protein
VDLSDLKPVERNIEILHPKTKEPIGVTVSILSINDDRLKNIKRKIQDQRLNLERKGKNFKSSDIEENEIALLFGAMVGWSWEGDACYKGEKPAFNKQNVSEVMTDLTWFKDQVMEEISDEENFFQI